MTTTTTMMATMVALTVGAVLVKAQPPTPSCDFSNADNFIMNQFDMAQAAGKWYFVYTYENTDFLNLYKLITYEFLHDPDAPPYAGSIGRHLIQTNNICGSEMAPVVQHCDGSGLLTAPATLMFNPAVEIQDTYRILGTDYTTTLIYTIDRHVIGGATNRFLGVLVRDHTQPVNWSVATAALNVMCGPPPQDWASVFIAIAFDFNAVCPAY